MKALIKSILLLGTFISLPALAGGLVLVEENHAEIEKNGISYIFDSYIVLFEQPYYILVQRKDKKPMVLSEVEPIAIEYILPRGCTSPLERRKDLDQKNEDSTKLLIGVAC